MKCPRCQADNEERLKFCEECGAPLARACPNCGAQVRPGKKFCGECGTTLESGPAARFASPQQYTPKHLADRILLSKEALEGERKQVTVLFADMKGSMELLADRDPEEARKLLDPVLEKMIEAVHRYEGTVNQVMGDGVMALFGAPLAHEDHAVRACYAALRMQESVRQYAQQVFATHGVQVEIRVGLNSGEVVVGAIGSDLRMEYTAVGQTTHLAARMEQMALPGTALMTASTLALAEGYVAVKPRGRAPVKGLAEPVEVFELAGIGVARTRLQAATIRGLTKFVGRDEEMAQLDRALEQAGSGHGRIVAVVGEPGVGKSRLFYEFTRSHRLQGWTVLESGSVSYGKATSYLPVIDLLKGYLRIHDGDTHRDIREKLAGKLLVLDETLKPLQPALLGLLGVPVQDEDWERLDPVHRRQRTLDACRRLLLRESQVQPLVTVFEDLHWIDTETQAYLDGLVESLPSAKILLLVNYRPEYAHRWGTKSYYTQLQVVPLPPQSAQALLEPLLGSDPGLHPVKTMLIERTEGNPLFLEESVRGLVETGVLSGTRGAYRLARVSHTFEVPATVQAILAARIDRLAPEDKRLLQAASVIGKDVAYALLERVASMSEDELHQRLAGLQAAEFLYETSLFPDLEYTFKHALTHEVAYSSMLHESRKGLHSRIVEAMEALYTDRLEEQVERVAQHAFRGELWSKAVDYFGIAGEKAIHRSAHRDGVAATEQALAALQHLPRTREVLEQGVDLRLKMRTSLIVVGEHKRMLDHAREAEKLAKELSDPLREGWSAAALCILVSPFEGPEQGVKYGERALSIARETQDAPLEWTANFALGVALLWLGQYRTALPFFYRSAEVARSGSSESPSGHLVSPGLEPLWSQRIQTSATANAYAAWCLAELGDFREALARGEEARRIAETVDFPYARGAAYEFLGFVYLRQGHLEPAITLLEQCLDLSRTADVPVLLVQMAMRLGYAYVLAGRITEAIAVLEEGRDAGDASRNMVWVPLTHAHLAEAYAHAGRYDDALRTGRHAIELTQQYKERSYEAWARYLLGNVHALLRPAADVQSARTGYLDALQIATELGMRPLIAQCHLALGSLPAGDAQESRAHLETAVTMFHEMGMQFWLEKAQAALKALA
jgi:class 3 adenylate cyclase/tetratricopeptide (TPR) repeat protein